MKCTKKKEAKTDNIAAAWPILWAQINIRHRSSCAVSLRWPLHRQVDFNCTGAAEERARWLAIVVSLQELSSLF